MGRPPLKGALASALWLACWAIGYFSLAPDIRERFGLAAAALGAIAAAGWLAADALTVIEVGAHEEFVPPAGFTLLDGRVYGAARLVFLRREATFA